MTRWILCVGALFSALSVLVGAFGAHALTSILPEKALGWIDTGVSYQTTHGLALIACGLLPSKTITRAAIAFILGITLFSGSLYIMALTGLTQVAILTPMGGLCFLIGWGLFIHSVLRL